MELFPSPWIKSASKIGMATLWSITKDVSVCNSVGCSSRMWTSPFRNSAEFSSSFLQFLSLSLLTYFILFFVLSRESHLCILASMFKVHCLILYFPQIQAQQWKYDLTTSFFWKHHPHLKLSASHLQVCLYLLHGRGEKNLKNMTLKRQFKVYLPKETSALFLFCSGQEELSVPSRGCYSTHHRYGISLSAETKRHCFSLVILIFFN